MQTIVVISFFGGAVLAQVAFWALLLRIGLRWAKASNISTRRVVLATVLTFAVNLAGFVVFALIPPTAIRPIPLLVAQLAVVVCGPAVVIMRVFKNSFGRSLQAWLPTLVSPAIFVAFALLVVRPYIFKTFRVPTGSMSPTLLPPHWTGKCADCGSAAYCTATPGQSRAREQSLAICEMNFHPTQPTEFDRRASGGDRFLVAKYLKPRRWDLVVFKYPENPRTIYVKRLVGLPGEEITIRDGNVWANGELLTPPRHVSGIKYTSEIRNRRGVMWGAPDNPARLGDDEYFVLGDFSPRAKDSRLWERGAPGHNPFAVPESYLRGVVTHIYWPMSRWRAFR
jgi:signal peptidase I